MFYKLVAFLILLLAAPAWGATYSIGPGQTYTTFAAFFAAVTPAAGDIIDGGSNTFTEEVTIPSGGSSANNVITYRNFTVDGENTRGHGIYSPSLNYLTFENVSSINSVQNGFQITHGSDYTFTNCTATGHTTATSGSINTGTGLAIHSNAARSNYTVSGGTYSGNVHGMFIYAYDSSVGRISNVTVTGVTASDNIATGIYIQRANTVSVTNNYLTSNGSAVDDHEDYNIALTSCDDAEIVNNILLDAVADDSIGVYSDATAENGSTNNLVIRRNKVIGSTGNYHDCIGFGTAGNQTATGAVISQNILAECAGEGITLYHSGAGQAASVSIYHNTIASNLSNGIEATADFPAVVKNNIFYSNADPDLNFANSTTGLTTSNNLWYRASGNVLSYNSATYTTANIATFEASAVASDPLLNAVYGIPGDSPAKDRAAVLYTYAAHPGDFLGAKVYGSAPDIGAIEYKDHTFGGWFFEMFIPTIFNLCASTNANCYTQP